MKSILLPFGLKPEKTKPETGPRYADLYERGLAAAVDVSLLFLLLNRIFTFITQSFYARIDREVLVQARDASGFEALALAWEAGLPQLWMINALVQIAIMGAFIVGCQLGWHTTPGKWLLGISIRRRRDLELPEPWRYVLRYFAYIPSAPIFFIVSFNKQRRTLHDMIAGTVVIHTRPQGWYWGQVKRLWRKLRGTPSV